jgi:hypothetical protein
MNNLVLIITIYFQGFLLLLIELKSNSNLELDALIRKIIFLIYLQSSIALIIQL